MKKKIIFYLALSMITVTLFFTYSFKAADEVNYEWKLTYEDNFDTFDRTKWINHHELGNRTIWSNKELQFYKDENVIAENGILKLIAKKESYYGKDTESEKQFDFTSGMICSSRGFTQAYGKWEIRAKFPFRKGFWPAFWLLAKQSPGLPEIDVFEYFGTSKNKMISAHHWGLDYPNYAGGMYEGKTAPFYYAEFAETEGKFSDEWMIWTFECFPNKMIWKLNDKIVFESAEGIPTAHMYMVANVAIKDRVENDYKVDNSDTPYIMEIDYIKVYKMVPKQN